MKNSLMLLGFEHINYLFEIVFGSTFHQDNLVFEVALSHFGDEILSRSKELSIHIKIALIDSDFFANTDEVFAFGIGEELE